MEADVFCVSRHFFYWPILNTQILVRYLSTAEKEVYWDIFCLASKLCRSDLSTPTSSADADEPARRV